MPAIRRGYIFLACAIALQATTWAVIYLARNLAAGAAGTVATSVAFQVAVIVVTGPIFLAHWRWAERLAARDPDERAALLRRVYLYAMLAAATAPFVLNLHGLLSALLGRVVPNAGADAAARDVVDPLVALAVLAVLAWYHRRVVRADEAAVPVAGGAATIRRLFALGFGAFGLSMASTGAAELVRRTLPPVGAPDAISMAVSTGIHEAMAAALVGIGVWTVFWTWAQRLAAGPDPSERRSALRALYLYAVVFIAVMHVVTNAAFLVAGALRRALDLAPSGDAREPLAFIVVGAVVWGYHARVLRADAAASAEAPRQAAIRRLYDYLVAIIGLTAFLVGLGGLGNVMIRSVTTALAAATDLREQLAWFTAAVVVGLPVWLLPWRRAQAAAAAPGDAGLDERRSTVRKLYLYLVLLGTGVTVITSAVYLVYRLVSWLIGATPAGDDLGTDLARALAFGVISGTAWALHALVLRSDDRANQGVQAARLAERRAVVLDTGDGIGAAVAAALAREIPALEVHRAAPADPDVFERLAGADLVVGGWDIAVARAGAAPVLGGLGVGADVAAAVAASAATKLVVPSGAAGWEWAGVDRWDAGERVEQVVHAVRQWAEGDVIRARRPLGAGALIGIAIAVVILLAMLGIPVAVFLGNLE